MRRRCLPEWRTPSARQASYSRRLSWGQTGSAKLMCATKPSPKKVEARPRGAVEELVGDDEIERPVFFLERSHRAERHDALDAQHFEAVNVGPEVELRGHDAVSPGVAGQEGNAPPGERSHHVGVRGRAQGVSQRDLALPFESRHRVQAAAPDHPDLGSGSSSGCINAHP